MLNIEDVKNCFINSFPEKEGWVQEDFGNQFSIATDQEKYAVSIHCTEFRFISIDFFNFISKDVRNFSFEIDDDDFDERLKYLKGEVDAFISSFQ